MSSGYGKGSMCGDCLHSKSAHVLYYGWHRCSACNKTCDPECFNKVHRINDVIVDQTHKIRIEMPEKRHGTGKPVEPAPVDLTGR